MNERGYFGVGIYHPKFDCNTGTLWRTAHSFGASFAFTIGPRYRRQASDTTDFRGSTPFFEFTDFESSLRLLPYSCLLVGIELDPRARKLEAFAHPERALYLLGAEDHGLPEAVREKCHLLVECPGKLCLNVAVAGSLVLYDRLVKGNCNGRTATRRDRQLEHAELPGEVYRLGELPGPGRTG